MTQSPAEDFLEDNAGTIKCLSLATADALFSTYMAIATYEKSSGVWWRFGYDAIQAISQLTACFAPPISAWEQAFDGDNLRCQCAAVGGELFIEYLDANGTTVTESESELVEAKEIEAATETSGTATCTWTTVEGLTVTNNYDLNGGSQPTWYIVPTLDTGCCIDSPIIPRVQPQPSPYNFVSPGGTNCPNTVQLISSAVDRFGFMQNFYYVELFGEVCQPTGRFFYWETVRGPVIYPTTTPGFEGLRATPPYAPPHPDAVDPSSLLSRSNPALSAVTYTLDVGCTYNPVTEDFDKKFTYDVEQTSEGILGLARRMDALAWMINNAQLIPYTECNKCAPVLEGDWVTVRFESQENSPQGTRPLRKLFRYRSQSALDLGQKAAYWENFTWNAGAVCVQHKGAWWGTPQCWASNVDEGKRVIRFAGLEAGIDPDVLGEWVISGSTDPRYGQPGTMTVATVQGLEWVTSRQGPSGLPLLTVDP
jgi:hypothetical protein